MDKNKKVLVLTTIGILVMIGCVVGLTYAWFSSTIEGDGAGFDVTTATVGPLTYTGTEITASGVLPGWISEDATLTVSGTITGNESVEYYCSIENTGEVTDVEYRISSDGEENSTNGTWTSIDVNPIVTGSISSTNASDEYKLAIRFKETGEDQNSQQNKELSVRVTCSVEEGELLYEKILVDNPNVNTRETFNVIYTESNNGNTIHKETFTQNETEYTTYYFAGNVSNNYVKFTNADANEMWWRIIRINEDNSVRLLYYGTDKDGSNMFPSTGQAFNTNRNNPSYVGYKYTVNEQHGLGTNSAMKTYLEGWYTSNLSSYDEYISRTAIYCNDRTIGSGSWNTGSTVFYYSVYTRLITNKTPTFACSNVVDRFTTSGSTGNAQLHDDEGNARPIGMITADEVAYAGGLYGTNNTSFYLAENANSSTSGAEYWWTMTPYSWGGSASGFVVGGSQITGRLISTYSNNSYGVRPVISLKSCVNWSNGDGTSDSPYEVTVNSTCATSEN